MKTITSATVNIIPATLDAPVIQWTRKARVIWPQDDEIAARVMTAAVPPKGGVQ